MAADGGGGGEVGSGSGSRGTLCGGQRGSRAPRRRPPPRGWGGEGEESTVLSSQSNHTAGSPSHRVLLPVVVLGPVCVSLCVHAHVFVCMGAHTCLHMHISVCTHASACPCVHTRASVYLCACVHVCVYPCVHL